MIDTRQKIRSRGHWEVVIRPSRFVATRIPDITDLGPLVQRCSVHLRGWDYPHVDPRVQPDLGTDWAAAATDWDQYVEYWRMYQSGQFAHLFGMEEDWRDQSKFHTYDPSLQWGTHFSFMNALFQYIEIFEFAARLTLTPAGDNQMVISVNVRGLRGRRLITEHPVYFPLRTQQTISIDEFPVVKDIARDELVTDPVRLGTESAWELLGRFGLKSSPATLRELFDAARRLQSWGEI